MSQMQPLSKGGTHRHEGIHTEGERLCHSPYLRVEPVLPVSLTGHHRPHLKHAVCGRQHPNVQLQELLRVVVGQNRDVHPGSAAPSAAPAGSLAGCTCSPQLAASVIINEEQDIYEPVSLAGVCNPT